METVRLVFSEYLECLMSGWWVMLSIVTFLYLTIMILKNDDPALSIVRALGLVLVGLLMLIPALSGFAPYKLRMDFLTRWVALEFCTFSSFVITFMILVFLCMPVILICIFGLHILDGVLSSVFAEDVKRYGLKRVVKLRLNIK